MFSTEKLYEQKSENIIVVIAMIAIVILTFVFFGWNTIKSWISAPLIWKDQDSLDVYYLATLPSNESEEDYNIFLEIGNNTNEEIDYYEISFEIEGMEFNYPSFSNDNISAYGLTDVVLSVTTSKDPGFNETKVPQDKLSKLINAKQENVDISCKIKKLESIEGETIVNNTGIFKNIIIIIISLLFGAFGFFGNISVAWLRILLKLLALPAILFAIIALILIAVFANGGSSDSRVDANDAAKKRAAKNYKREANLKAEAFAHGTRRDAAFAQARMDKHMADMIGGSSSVKNEYKRQAQLKAGFIAHGNQKEAAKCQAAMDRLMAQMINDK